MILAGVGDDEMNNAELVLFGRIAKTLIDKNVNKKKQSCLQQISLSMISASSRKRFEIVFIKLISSHVLLLFSFTGMYVGNITSIDKIPRFAIF